MAYLALFTSVLMSICLALSSESATLSLKLVHRFSDEARVATPGGVGWRWPSVGSMEYYRTLLRSDLHRQKRRLGTRYQALYPDEGSEAFSLGNDFGWLVLLFSFFTFNYCFAQWFFHELEVVEEDGIVAIFAC